jgi:glycosyl transferase family 87
MEDTPPVTNDFVEYWAAARLFLNGGNPYAPDQLFKLEQSVGWRETAPLPMWNPPWTLSFIWPLGLLDYDTAQFIWFVLHALIIFLGAQMLWRIYGGDALRSRPALLSVLSFAPVYFVLLLGQIGPLILLGLIFFVSASERRLWFRAGVGLLLVAIKPHLLFLLWPALVLWIVKERQWYAALCFVLCGIVALALPLLINQSIYFDYARMFSEKNTVNPADWATPNLGTILALIYPKGAGWVRWLPTVAGTLWLIWHWTRQSGEWSWGDQLPLLSLVSVSTSSFVWTFDLVVLLPAVVQCAARLSRQIEPRKLIVSFYLIVSAALFFGKVFWRNDLWYFWAAPALLALYLAVQQKTTATRSGPK